MEIIFCYIIQKDIDHHKSVLFLCRSTIIHNLLTFHVHFFFRKSCSKNNSKALGKLRQVVRKYNRDFTEDIEKFKENPDLPDDDEDEEDQEKGKYNAHFILSLITMLMNELLWRFFFTRGFENALKNYQ